MPGFGARAGGPAVPGCGVGTRANESAFGHRNLSFAGCGHESHSRARRLQGGKQSLLPPAKYGECLYREDPIRGALRRERIRSTTAGDCPILSPTGHARARVRPRAADRATGDHPGRRNCRIHSRVRGHAPRLGGCRLSPEWKSFRLLG